LRPIAAFWLSGLDVSVATATGAIHAGAASAGGAAAAAAKLATIIAAALRIRALLNCGAER